LDDPLTILPNQTIEIVVIEKKVMVGRTMRSAYWLNHDPSGLVERGTVRRCNGVTVLETAFLKRRYAVATAFHETPQTENANGWKMRQSPGSSDGIIGRRACG
jgi:hypothetical protein